MEPRLPPPSPEDMRKTKKQLAAELQQARERLERLQELVSEHDAPTPLRGGQSATWAGSALQGQDRLVKERRSAYEEARRQHAFTRAITENLDEGVITLDHEGRLTFMNAAAREMLGWTMAELMGKMVHERIHSQRSDGTPLPEDQCDILRVLQTGISARSDDNVFIRKDGSTFPISFLSSPIMNNGQVIGSVVAFHDNQERKRLEEALRAHEAEATARASQLEAIFETLTDGVLVYDKTGGIVRANRTARTLLPWIAQDADDLSKRMRRFTLYDDLGIRIPRENLPVVRVLAGETLSGAHAMEGWVTSARRKGVRKQQAIHMRFSGAPFIDAAGAVAGAVMIVSDLTERRRIEQRTRNTLHGLLELLQAETSGRAAPKNKIMGQRLANVTRTALRCKMACLALVERSSGQLLPLAVAGLSTEHEQLWWRETENARLSDYFDTAQITRLRRGEMLYLTPCVKQPMDSARTPGENVLVAPMRRDTRLIGVIGIERGSSQGPRASLIDETTLIAEVAAYAGLALGRSEEDASPRA